MLEHIANNSMYTTDIRDTEPFYEETQSDYFDSTDYLVEANRIFIREEQYYLEDLLKHEPIME